MSAKVQALLILWQHLRSLGMFVRIYFSVRRKIYFSRLLIDFLSLLVSSPVQGQTFVTLRLCKYFPQPEQKLSIPLIQM